ncbi:hypothetical protein Y032_0199g1670 [Ancylostoma ceylanicum]|uniref:Uncharacterized protein n=1 Tax=Ancylostoma ceylanicum TaxID=53326 RepID=A0A016SNT2_9BILA|nr:hypothetical protein Y032_0199g1670 [Ancylostoma ceylanicum]
MQVTDNFLTSPVVLIGISFALLVVLASNAVLPLSAADSSHFERRFEIDDEFFLVFFLLRKHGNCENEGQLICFM